MRWNSTFTGSQRPLNRIGKVGKRRLALVAELTEQAREEGWLLVCEVAPVLRAKGISFARCSGPKTFAHSVKTAKRGKDPVLDREVCRSCTQHHFYVLDLLEPELTREIVTTAIRWREAARTRREL